MLTNIEKNATDVSIFCLFLIWQINSKESLLIGNDVTMGKVSHPINEVMNDARSAEKSE